MNWRAAGIGVLVVLLTAGAAGSARAAGEAFIGLTDIGSAGWSRDGAIKEILEAKLGYDTVRLALDVTPRELPEQVGAFLSRRGAAGGRRFVWVSGADIGGDSPCPGPETPMIVAATAALIVAPECYAEAIALPPGTLHIALRDTSSVAFPTDRLDNPPIVFVALPADSPAAVRLADAIVLEALRAAEGRGLTPAALLQRLRLEFRVDGSDYTPSLAAAPGEAAWSRRFLTPPQPRGVLGWRPAGSSGFADRRARPRADGIDLFATADPGEPPVLTLLGRQPVTVLRTSADGSMGYARAPGALFGWVRLDALE